MSKKNDVNNAWDLAQDIHGEDASTEKLLYETCQLLKKKYPTIDEWDVAELL